MAADDCTALIHPSDERSGIKSPNACGAAALRHRARYTPRVCRCFRAHEEAAAAVNQRVACCTHRIRPRTQGARDDGGDLIFWLGVALGGTWLTVPRTEEGAQRLSLQPAARSEYASLVRDLAAGAASGVIPEGAAARARAIDLDLRREGSVLTLAGLPGGAAPDTVVVIRVGALAEELVLQMPHPTSDLYTGEIGGAIFDAGKIRAACFATAKRDAFEGADVAHNATSLFQGATDGLADALVDPLFVQLHGFAPGTTDADAVVSEGAGRMLPGELGGAARRIAAALDARDVRTGDEVGALAARTNTQSRLLVDRARFLHLELAILLRSALRDSAPIQASLVGALVSIAAREPAPQ
jgi:hypothetical protein